jgi:hypothetical protein
LQDDWKAVSFDAGTVGPNIHKAEEEKEEKEEVADYEGQGECGFLRALQVIARHGKTVHDLSPDLPPFRSVCERPTRSVCTPCYALACRNRGQAVGNTGHQAVSLRYFNSALGGPCEEPKRVATCYWHLSISLQITFRKYSMEKFKIN